MTDPPDEYEWLPSGWDAVPEPRSHACVQYKRADFGAVVTRSSADGMWAVVLRGGHRAPRFQSEREAVHAAEQLVGYPYALDGWDAHHALHNLQVAFTCSFARLAVWLGKPEGTHAMVRGGFEPYERGRGKTPCWWYGTAPAVQHAECYLTLAPEDAGADRRVFSSVGDRPDFHSAIAAAMGEHRAGPPAMPGDFDRAYALLRDVPDNRPGFVVPESVTRVDVELRGALHQGPVQQYGVVTMEAVGPICERDLVVATEDGRVRRADASELDKIVVGRVREIVGPK